ncbi:MAG: PocR ligand-binding domain-containing protein [Desulfitobacteriaceae bacterium]
MKYKFSEIVDISKLQKLMEGFYSAAHILLTVLDTDANILIAVGWQDICAKFHRVNTETEILCKQSNLYIKNYLNDHIINNNNNLIKKDNILNSEANICYKCANGLINVAAPIIIDGEHLATVYTGQFLFEEPDVEQFRKRAGKYGFNEKDYLNALKKVPIFTKEQVDSFMNYVREMAEMLAQMGLAKLRLIESQKKALQEREVRLKTIINNTPNVAIQSYDENGIIQFVNKASEVIFGWTCDEAVGKTIDQLIPDKETVNKFLQLIKVVYETGEPIEVNEFTIINKLGMEKSLFTTVFPIYLSKEKREFICLNIDITEKKHLEKEMYRSEEALKESERLLRKSQKVAHLGSIIIDLKTQTWKGSPETNEIFGIEETYPHTVKGWDALIHPDWRKKCLQYYLMVEAEKLHYDYEYKIIRINDGAERWVHGLGDLEFDDQSNPVRLIGTIQDITKRKKAEEEIIYLSYHDKLTGLYNRRFCEEEIKRLDTERNLPISIIIGDVNGLKVFNDAFGHDKGDELLQKAAAAIQSACRTDDIVARWGGDEFVILLPKTKTEDVEEIVNRIEKQYSNERVNTLSVSISFGWDIKRKTDENILKVLNNAEDNMYKHKIVENVSNRSNIISTIIETLHEKNPREEQHSKRVSEICQNIGRTMGLSEIEVNKLKVVGLLHDIGKIAIEESILNKSGKLTEQERDEIRRHPDIGYRIISTSYDMLELADCILAHHERWDGTGYPKGLKGEAIPKIARIIALADSYDAMTRERPYRKVLNEEEAIIEIRKNAGKQFDPKIARMFVEKVLVKRWD